MKAVEEESGRISASEIRRWGEVKKGYTPFQEGDVIFAKITPCMENGKYALAEGLHGGKAAGSTEFHVFRPAEKLDSKYLLYYLFDPVVRQGAKMKMRGAAGQLRVPVAFFEDLQIPLPPIDEQRQIVVEIEKQFTRLDAGVAALKRAQSNLKRYRAAVLKAACEGRLVPTEGELARKEGRSYETGEQLLARILEERRKKWQGRERYKEPVGPDVEKLPALPVGWAWASVEQVGFVQLGRQRSPKNHLGKFMRPYLRVANIFEDKIDLSDVKEMNFTPKEFELFKLKPNDILLNEGQSLELVGRPALFQGELPNACFQNTLVRFQPSNLLNPRFALIIFRSFFHTGAFQKIAKWTTNIAHLGADRFAKMTFPLPPLVEQLRIINEVEKRLSVVEEMEAVSAFNFQRVNRLRQAILQQAFKIPILAR